MLSSRSSDVRILKPKKSNFTIWKIDRLTVEDIVLKLIEAKCLLVLLYGLDACPTNSADMSSFDFVLTRSLVKSFQTNMIVSLMISYLMNVMICLI